MEARRPHPYVRMSTPRAVSGPGRVVEVPGIEPGSSGASTRLLRAQLTVPLLGPSDHVSKSE